MVTTVTKHIPGFAYEPTDGPPPMSLVQNLHELFSIPWVMSWSNNRKFSEWRRSDEHLMATFKGGEFWVVARCDPPTILDALPVWNPPD